MDYRKECESRLLEVSIGAHKLTQMISSWSKEPNLDNERSKNVNKDLVKGSFDLEESVITLEKLQQATRMMSRVRQNLELDLDKESGLEQEAVGFGFLTHSRRLESTNCIEELKKVIKESSYSRNIGSVSKRAEGPSLIAKLMGLESIPSDIGHSARKEQEDKFLVQLEPPLGIEMLKARMLPVVRRNTRLKDVVETVMSKGLMEKNGINDCTNATSSYGNSSYSSPSNRSSHTYGEVDPPIVMLQTPQLPNREKFRSKKVIHETVCDNIAQILSGKLEKKEVAKPQDSKQIACARRRMSSGTKRENVAQRSLLREKKLPAAKMDKATPSPISQAKLSSRAQAKLDKNRAAARSGEQVVPAEGANGARSHWKPDSWDSMEAAKAKKKKKKKEVKPARKARDIILAATGNAMYNDAKTINQSRTLTAEALPKHMENSKQCNRGHRRKDSKLFCEVMVKTIKGGRNSRPSSSEANAEEIKLFLRSSQSFITRAQELCRIDDCHQTAHHQKKSAVEVRAKNAKLILGCAREFIVRKSLQLECSNHPIVRTRLSRSSAIAVSVDQLVEEIANEIDKLSARSKFGKGASSDQDNVDVMIEGDIGCKDVLLNAMWDQGWMDLICLEEVRRVVSPLERIILYGLVEELVLDLLH